VQEQAEQDEGEEARTRRHAAAEAWLEEPLHGDRGDRGATRLLSSRFTHLVGKTRPQVLTSRTPNRKKSTGICHRRRRLRKPSGVFCGKADAGGA